MYCTCTGLRTKNDWSRKNSCVNYGTECSSAVTLLLFFFFSFFFECLNISDTHVVEVSVTFLLVIVF